MDSSFPASSRRSYDIPSPETGLAEWTSKIKALQREVDADEEAEQKRLEEEISAARQARLRRSRGPGAGGRADSLDMSTHKEQFQRFDSANDSSMNDGPKSTAERINDQETALRKLMGRNEVYNPDKLPPTARTSTRETPSLAAFIGGHATGPRLNRHAPQVDAHDPTQFIQPDLSAPHPIFGKGGVAMPGMASKKDNKIPSSIGSEISELYRPSTVGSTPSKSLASPAINQNLQTASEPSQRDSTDFRRQSSTFPTESPPTSLDSESSEKSDLASDHSSHGRNDPAQRNQNSFFTTKPLSFMSTPKKEEPTFRESSPFPSKATDTYRSTPTSVSKALPTYSGTTGTPKFISGTNLPKKVVEPSAPLRRIMESNNVYNPDKVESEAPRKTIAERAQGVSLAGFMGGNAAGPRLNRHAPQVDAHDPTQFIQPDTSAPHPIFGKGGVAMPGMATRKSTGPSTDTDNVERYRPSSASKPTWPPVATAYINKTQERPVSPQKTINRERTTSTPGLRPNLESSASQFSGGRIASTSNSSVLYPSPTKDLRPTTPVRDRTISGPSYSQNTAAISTPSLARPIQPQPNYSSHSPQISGVVVPSPAFQKPTPPKDLTPSISRLQGRGFVQSMVKVSAQLEVPASPTPQTSAPSRPTSAAGRKGSVLDRWQPNAQSSSPTKSPTFPDPMRRSTTQEATVTHSYSPRTPISGGFTGNSSHALKSVASLPSIAKSASTLSKTPTPEPVKAVDPYPRSRTPGLGSATTMVLIKPSKSSTDLTQLTHVDELGVKRDLQTARADRVPYSSETPSSKKPLIHPTKDRPKKPKKREETRESTDQIHETVDVVQPLSASPEPQNHLLQQPDLLTAQRLDAPLQRYQDSSLSPFENSTQKVVLPEKTTNNIEIVDHVIGRPSSSALAYTESDMLQETPLVIEQKISSELHRPESPIRHSSPSSPPVASSPSKHVRIPSTGSRPTVMEVAQLLSDHPSHEPQSNSLTSTLPSPANEGVLLPDFITKSRVNFSQLQAEKRKSSYEKYSAITLPPLKEEATPTPTPAGTLKRGNGGLFDLPKDIATMAGEDLIHHTKEYEASLHGQATEISKAPKASPQPALPYVDVTKLFKSQRRVTKLPADNQTVSVEVLAITGTSATPITGPSNIFYDTEILSIVHRVKSKSTGLVSTAVWCWLGSRSILGDREGRKLDDLAKRYGTSAKIVHQLAETPELIQLFGGTLAIRQGTRTHWSAENTTMHLVRSLNGQIVIDEHDLNIKNLCSAFSYCLTILGSVYVWHGCGSTLEERDAALIYSSKLTNDSIPPTELLEGETDNDEMFWMILGDENFAKADYWRWRKTSSDVDPSVWRIAMADTKNLIHPVQFISMEEKLQESIYVINCIWELFILVGKDARGDKTTIRLALDVAMRMAEQMASSRPHTPTVHALIVPSQIPLDLRLSIRDLNEAWLNDGQIPDHMNLLSSSEAANHLLTQFWEMPALKDTDMLPLGVDLTDL